ncbi:hypothetical protein ASE61_07295 [Bosea sp. Root670]|uniref:hypothetical protein n=1 Tax=Bosea sp. Root670 TaxID=1736583 RepID=UPI000715D34E|nr:hypothetical protein [Bosea sp. Root670]KRE04715.1 hypothetical protein ASE61_07295 [Bosea sp. Root670]
MTDYNRVFERICAKSQSEGDQIIAYIAYGVYKEQKRDFLMRRKEELGGPVPTAEIDVYHRTWGDGQINLVWESATQALAQFAVSYADAEKQKAVQEALTTALKGSSLRQLWTAIIANIGAAIITVFVYFALRFVGFDLIDQIKKLERIVPS